MKCFQCILSLAIVVSALNASMAQGPPQPTEEHKVLEQEVGTWNAKGKMWMPGSSEATEFEGVETNRSIGGMWIVSDFKGNFFGQPFEGHATMGYNLKTKKYVGRWMDNMSAYTSEMEGTYDADTKTLTMNSSGVDAATGNSTKGKNVVVYKDANTRHMTMYMADPANPGEMMKGMEIIYTRKKAGGSGSK